MDVLGGLVRLDMPEYLPIPWFNRPALGLASGSIVRIGLVRSQTGQSPPPEVIVTPLNTDRWASTIVIVVDFVERPGALKNILQAIPSDLNIALAESATTYQRLTHRVTLVLEPRIPETGRDHAQRARVLNVAKTLIERLKETEKFQGADHFFVDGDTIISKTGQNALYPNRILEFEIQRSSVVYKGRAYWSSIRQHIEEHYASVNTSYDFERVVVSSDTERRLVRYLFPKKGTFEARITAVDQPQTLIVISEILEALGYNILLSRLSRSFPSAVGTSMFVAICEPNVFDEAQFSEPQYVNYVTNRIKSAFGPPGMAGADLVDPTSQAIVRPPPPALQIALAAPVSLGRSIAQVAYPQIAFKHSGRQEISAQQQIMNHIPSYGRSDRKVIFLSYQREFADTMTGREFLNRLVSVVQDAGFDAYDGFDRPRMLEGGQPSDARARMWLADAAIFVALNKEGVGLISSNQLVEWGYIFGQCKPYDIITMASYENVIRPFMMPDTSFITLNSMGIAEVERVMQDIRTILSRIRTS